MIMEYTKKLSLGFLILGLAITSLWPPRPAHAQRTYSFIGHIDFLSHEFEVKVQIDDKSSVAATAKKLSDTDYELLLDIEHLKTPLFDLLSKIGSSVEVVSNNKTSRLNFDEVSFKGSVWSNYSLLDYKPVQELSGNYEIRDNKLILNAISFGGLSCNGEIDLVRPFNMDLAVDLRDIPMKDFLNFWGMRKKYDSAGLVSGVIKASGPVDNMALKGNLASRNGFVHKLDFDVITLNIAGVYPDMKISDSAISKSDGVSFNLDGPFDLSDKGNFKKQIKALTLSPLVSDSGNGLEWTIKRVNPEDSGTSEIKYRFRKGDALGTGTSVDDETDMFGFERTNKF